MHGNEHIEGLIGLLMQLDPKIPYKLVRAFLFDELFILASRAQKQWRPAIGNRQKIPFSTTFFTVAPSGGGKGSVQGLMNRTFGAYIQAYKAETELKLATYNGNVKSRAMASLDGNADAGKKTQATKAAEEYIKTNSVFMFTRMNTQIGSTQGVSRALDTMRLLKIGSYCHRMDECASIITSQTPSIKDFLDTLLSFSGGTRDVGRSLARESAELSAEGVGCNLHMFGNPDSFAETEKTLAIFKGFLKKGFSRRSFFTHVLEKKTYTVQDNLFEPDYSCLKEWDSFFLRRYNDLRADEDFFFDFSNEARVFIAELDVASQVKTGNKDHDTERGDHSFKAQKLACILSMIDASPTVEKCHCEQAAYYVRESSKDYLSLLGEVEEEVLAKTDIYSQQMATAIIKASKPLGKTELIRKLSPRPRVFGTLDFENMLAEAQKIMDEEGFALRRQETENKRGETFSAIPLEVAETIDGIYNAILPPETIAKDLAFSKELASFMPSISGRR